MTALAITQQDDIEQAISEALTGLDVTDRDSTRQAALTVALWLL